ncbi:hypothetical protein [Catenulispora subtropica]|uniref:hypothetical protein n=1 Tax=Catenulispora subtropica TaxID=450798 RepID=UPI0031D75CDF
MRAANGPAVLEPTISDHVQEIRELSGFTVGTFRPLRWDEGHQHHIVNQLEGRDDTAQ